MYSQFNLLNCISNAVQFRRAHTRTPSLAPSDSISMVPPPPAQIRHQPAVRPAHYPPELLWSLEDSKVDIDVATSESNLSRPAMASALRHADGTDLNDGEYRAIKATAHAIAHELNQLPVPKGRNLEKKSRTMRFYKKNMLREWNQAVADAEAQQELLMLCSAHWKAEHVLQTALQAAHTTCKCQYTNGTIADMFLCTDTKSKSGSSARRKRSRSPSNMISSSTRRKRSRSTSNATSGSSNKRGRSDSTTDRAVQNLHSSEPRDKAVIDGTGIAPPKAIYGAGFTRRPVADSVHPVPPRDTVLNGTKGMLGVVKFGWKPTTPDPIGIAIPETMRPTLVDPSHENLISMYIFTLMLTLVH